KNRSMELANGPRFMGIVNVTPDSFSDGGKFFHPEIAVARAAQLLEEGADIIDIGGESTRPGAEAVSEREEISRVVPVICELKRLHPECVISIDTRKAKVASAAVNAGADIINDVSGLEYSPEIAKIAATGGTGLILMHMRGLPQNMQNTENLVYENIVEEVVTFLAAAAQKALDSGVKRENIVLDPGIGFAKTFEHNFQLLGEIDRIKAIGYPVMVGHSRKAFIGTALNRKMPEDRVFGTAGVAAFLADKGVDILRVHDVGQIRDAVTMFKLCRQTEKSE
ncbi:MAG: dihydropteroate synthase, partial [Victivallaceae bacterium]